MQTFSQPQFSASGDDVCCSLSNQNESDVLKWVVRKEFGELQRCLEVEEAGFMQQVETSAAVLISSLQNQTDQLNQNLNRLQEAHNTLQDLSNEGHLDFIMVPSVHHKMFESSQHLSFIFVFFSLFTEVWINRSEVTNISTCRPLPVPTSVPVPQHVVL